MKLKSFPEFGTRLWNYLHPGPTGVNLGKEHLKEKFIRCF